MLPPSHVAYTWLALSVAQAYRPQPHRLPAHRLQTTAVDYRLIALAAIAPDLIDKPLAWAYFYKRYKAAVLFAHTLLANGVLFWLTGRYAPKLWIYTLAFGGHALLDRIWLFPNTFYWPLRGWRFHVWGKRGSEQTEITRAYWVTFTRRPELWGWEVGGMVALAIFIWYHRLYQWSNLRHFLLTGRVAWPKQPIP